MISGALKTLEAQNIPVSCLTAAITHVGDLIRNSKDGQQVAATKLIKSLLGDDSNPDHFNFTDDHTARHLALHVVKQIFDRKDNFDPIEVLDSAVVQTKITRTKPELKWCWTTAPIDTGAIGGGQYVDEGETVKEVGDAGAKVVIKKDGSIKKGGRKPATQALYRKHVLEAETPMGASAFIQLLMKELKMSLYGARTYNYNCRKELGVPKNADGTVKEGVSAPRAGKKGDNGPSRQSRANVLYIDHVVGGEKMDKPTFQKLLVEKVETTTLGAQTMYYAAKKLHEAGKLTAAAAPAPAVVEPAAPAAAPVKKASAKKPAKKAASSKKSTKKATVEPTSEV